MRELEDRIFEIVSQNEKSDLEQEILYVYDESLEDGIDANEFQRLLELLAQRDMEKSVVLASAQQSLLSLDIASSRPRIRPENFPEERPRESLNYDTDWNEMEPNGGFQDINGENLSGMIEELGLSSNILILCKELFGRELTQYEASQVALTIRYLLEAETYGGLNKAHDPGFPGSGGYFEYQKNDGETSWEVYDFSSKTFRAPNENDTNLREVKNLNGENSEWIRSVWHESSYDVALSRIPESILSMDPILRSEQENIGNPDAQDMTKLNAEQQVMVVLSDIHGDSRGPDLLDRIIRGDRSAIAELYAHIHHTDTTNPKTNELKARLNRDLLGLQVARPVSRTVSRPDDLDQIVLASKS